MGFSKMYKTVSSFENLIAAHKHARNGNWYKQSACYFELYLENNLIKLKSELKDHSFQPSPYKHFIVTDPKMRHVAAPAFRDRVVQHSLVSMIEPIFDKTFIYDSYACRVGKGTHFALKRVKKFLMAARCKYGKNTPIYFLKCDVRKFFPSISWDILLSLIKKKITCPETIELIEKIVTNHKVLGEDSGQPGQLTLFCDNNAVSKMPFINDVVSCETRRGLPIGNLTSQLFANVYLNELDHFVKVTLCLRWYGRYMDDFFIIHPEKELLKETKLRLAEFVQANLQMRLHEKKSYIQNVNQGLCFVGYRVFYDHVLIRGDTLRRMRRKLKKRRLAVKKGIMDEKKLESSKMSMLGHLKYANAYNLRRSMFKDLD